MMQTQRTILWVIFVMSLLFLWDSWQKHNGRPSLFGGPPPSTGLRDPTGVPDGALSAPG